jgi:nucleotide-binding universal stress UspA family protein
LATDGSRESVPAVRTAVELAKGTGSELYVVHTVSTAPKSPYPHYWQIQQRNTVRDRKRLAALALLEEMIRQVEELGGIVAGSHYREGKPGEEVAQLAEEFEVGLIVAGGRELGRFAFHPEFFGECLPPRTLRGAGSARTRSVGRADNGPTAAFEHPGIRASFKGTCPTW